MVAETRRGLLVAAAISAAALVATPALARLVNRPSYKELFAKSDLIVIARPETKTRDTSERTFFKDMATRGADGTQHPSPAIGVETDFSIIKLIKGTCPAGRFTLHHFREPSQPPPDPLKGQVGELEIDGPQLVFFDGSDIDSHRHLLMFLRREADGRYAPYGGQTDPGSGSIFALTAP